MVRSAHQRSSGFYVALIAWLVLCVVLIRADLGVLAFVGSILLAICSPWGLRDKFSSETTASAYSVFNENGQAIAGGFTMDQLDRQLRGGQRAVKEDLRPTRAAKNTANGSNQKDGRTTEQQRLRHRTDAALAAERRMQMDRGGSS